MQRRNYFSKASWSDRAELILLVATAIISFLIALLDFIGALDSVTWLAERIPTLILLAVGFIASYLALERRNQFEGIFATLDGLLKAQSDSTRLIIDSLQGLEIRSFNSGTECLEHIIERISQAKLQIDDISLRPDFGLGNKPDVIQLLDSYQKIAAQVMEKVPYREIVALNSPHSSDRLQWHIKNGLPGYLCSYFEQTSEISPLRFMLIDDQEVIIFANLPSSNLAIRHPRFVRLFKEYFEDIWQKSWKLKIYDTVYWERVEKVLGESVTRELMKDSKLYGVALSQSDVVRSAQ